MTSSVSVKCNFLWNCTTLFLKKCVLFEIFFKYWRILILQYQLIVHNFQWDLLDLCCFSGKNHSTHWKMDWLIGLFPWSIDWLISWLIVRLIDQSIDWLIEWSMYWTIDWLIGWLIDQSIDRLISWSIDSLWTCFASFAFFWRLLVHFVVTTIRMFHGKLHRDWLVPGSPCCISRFFMGKFSYVWRICFLPPLYYTKKYFFSENRRWIPRKHSPRRARRGKLGWAVKRMLPGEPGKPGTPLNKCPGAFSLYFLTINEE